MKPTDHDGSRKKTVTVQAKTARFAATDMVQPPFFASTVTVGRPRFAPSVTVRAGGMMPLTVTVRAKHHDG
jgi:hypothetical protein